MNEGMNEGSWYFATILQDLCKIQKSYKNRAWLNCCKSMYNPDKTNKRRLRPDLNIWY